MCGAAGSASGQPRVGAVIYLLISLLKCARCTVSMGRGTMVCHACSRASVHVDVCVDSLNGSVMLVQSHMCAAITRVVTRNLTLFTHVFSHTETHTRPHDTQRNTEHAQYKQGFPPRLPRSLGAPIHGTPPKLRLDSLGCGQSGVCPADELWSPGGLAPGLEVKKNPPPVP